MSEGPVEKYCDGCRDITPLAYNLHHAQRRIEELERENAFLRSEIARAIERGSETMRDVLEDILRRRKSA
jgi:hypothetical protein